MTPAGLLTLASFLAGCCLLAIACTLAAAPAPQITVTPDPYGLDMAEFRRRLHDWDR